MQNKNYSGPQLGPRWAAQVSSQPSYMHANIKISVGPNWAPDGLAQMGSPLGTHLKTVAKVNWAPSGLPTWGPSDSPSGPHLWPSCTCWLGNKDTVFKERTRKIIGESNVYGVNKPHIKQIFTL